MTAAEGDAPPRVSVVVPAYNCERFLEATIDSVRAQTLTDWELVVWDDGSQDRTREIAQRCADGDERVRVLGGRNGGVATARNRGYAATDRRSEYVIFLDHDDVWEPHALATLAGALDAGPQYVGASALARCIDEHGDPPAGDDLETTMQARRALCDGGVTLLRPDDPTSFAALVLEHWMVTPGNHLLRRWAVDSVGGFDASTVPCDDWDMAIRLSRLGDIAFVDRPVLRWRRHAGALSGTSPRWRRAYFRVRDKTLTDPANTPQQARLARRAYRDANRAAWSAVWSAARRRQLGEAGRRGARALDGTVRYGRATVAARLPRR